MVILAVGFRPTALVEIECPTVPSLRNKKRVTSVYAVGDCGQTIFDNARNEMSYIVRI